MIDKSCTMMLASSKIMYFIKQIIKHPKMIYFNKKNTKNIHLKSI
jgi:hypothetical protein